MKILIALLLLIPSLVFGQSGTTWPPGPSHGLVGDGGTPGPSRTPEILICQSKKPITNLSQELKCGEEKTNLQKLNAYKISQILKTKKGYIYYFEKR